MDIYSFVNSRDIREHLRSIGYKFDPLEAAWLIHECRSVSYEKKRDVWKELMETMPDCDMNRSREGVERKSLFNVLNKYIGIIDREMADFCNSDGDGRYVYMYSYYCRGDKDWIEEHRVFSSFEVCVAAYRADVYEPGYDMGVLRHRIRRVRLNDPDAECEAEFFENDELAYIVYNSDRNDAENNVIRHSFDGLGIEFPTPFKKGDILWIPKNDFNIDMNGGLGFVLDSLITWYGVDKNVRAANFADMYGYGYFVNDDGTVYWHPVEKYMDLEYYRGPYKLNERIFTALSKFLKKECSLTFLLCAYRNTLLDVAKDDPRLLPYTDEMLREIGMESR